MEDGMWDRFLFLVIVFVSNVIQVITGFAGTMLAMPPSIRLLGADQARVILNSLGLCVSLGICIHCRKKILWRKFGNIVVWMGLGMFSGVILLKFLPQNILLYGYGLTIIGIAFKNMVYPDKKVQMEKFGVPILIVAGIIHGMFVSGGALLVVYAAETIADKGHFRATISAVWVVLNTVLLMNYIYSGLFTCSTLILGIGSLVPLFLAFMVGNFLYGKISQRIFLKITYILLMISGVSIII